MSARRRGFASRAARRRSRRSAPAVSSTGGAVSSGCSAASAATRAGARAGSRSAIEAASAHSLTSVAVKSWSAGAASASDAPVEVRHGASRGRGPAQLRAARRTRSAPGLEQRRDRARPSRARRPCRRRTGCGRSGGAIRPRAPASLSRTPPARSGCRARRGSVPRARAAPADSTGASTTGAATGGGPGACAGAPSGRK